MLGTMMLPTVVRETRQQSDETVFEQTTGDQTDGSNGGMASPANSTNSEDSTGPITMVPTHPQELARKNPFPMPSRIHDPLELDFIDSSNNNLIAARPTVPRLYGSYSSQRKEGIKGEMAVHRGPRLSRLLTTEQLEELERTYQTDPYPDYFQLGIKIGLKSHQVRHWFQTRRKSNRGSKRSRIDSDEALMDEAVDEEINTVKYDEDSVDGLGPEVRDFSRKRKHLISPRHQNGHTPPVALPKTARQPTPSLDGPGHDIGPVNYNMQRLPKSMAPVSAPQAHSNGMTSHPNATAASIYRMMSSQPPTHRQGSIPPNVNVALHPAFGMQWQLPTPTVESLLEKGDLEVLVEQRDFLRSMLEQQEALRFMWDQQITTLKRLLNVCDMKISRERSREHKQAQKPTKPAIQKAHSHPPQVRLGIPQPTSSILSPITSTSVSSEAMRSLLTTHSDVIAPMPPLLATSLGTGPLRNCHSKIITPMYGGVAIDLRSDLTSTASPTPSSSRRPSRDDVDSRIEADMSEFSEAETEDDFDDPQPIDLSSSGKNLRDDRWRGIDSTNSKHVRGKIDRFDDFHQILPNYPSSHRGTPDMQTQIKMEMALSEDGDGDSPSDGGWRRRRKRTVFSLIQLQRMEEIFKVTHYPSYADRDEIAQELGLTDETVRVWFKNRRAKVMREKGDVKAQGNLQQVVDDIKSERTSPS